MTIKYNVSGAKARNGKEIAPMAFGDRAEAERFAKYHEGLSVPQNLRKVPGIVVATETFSAKGHPQNLPKAKGTCIDGKEHGPWADNYTYCTTCGFYDVDKFEPTAEQTKAAEEFFARPVESLALHHQEVGRLTRIQDIVTITTQPPDNESDADKYAACEDAMKMNDNMSRYGTIDAPRSATVGNADLESAYEMGFRLGMSAHYDSMRLDAAIETQDYVDQRRSDLKALVSYDRSI